MTTAMIKTMNISRGTIPMDEFLWRIILAATGIAVAAGPLGSVVLWRRMVYFGDTISHAALLGVAFALALNLPVFLGVLLCALGVAAVVMTSDGRFLHTDTMLGVAAHSALALGLVAVSLLGGVTINLMNYLIGDILAVSWQDVAIIWGGASISIGLLVWRWEKLLVASLDRDMALAAGQNPNRENALFTLALAILVAVAIKVVGALLITALLIIPAATARLGAQTPERMVVIAALVGGIAALLGLFGSFRFDVPTGPSIVVASLILLIAANFSRHLRARLQNRR
ncbi:MAG: zinc transport system permease protein [Paracoccaceae bacterium]|jgi:zinc transport system permease protein